MRNIITVLVALILVLVIGVVGAASATPETSERDLPPCPTTDVTGQLASGSGLNGNDRVYCEYGQPYDLKQLCNDHAGKPVHDAKIVNGRLRCIGVRVVGGT